MKSLNTFRGALFLAFLSTAGLVHADRTVLKRPPDSDFKSQTPLNLARTYLGATIESGDGSDAGAIEPGILNQDPNGGLAALISDDETIGFPMKVGKTRFLVTLPRPDLLSSVEFTSFSILGKVDVWVSSVKLPSNDPGWRQVVRSKPFAEDHPFFAKFGSADAAYVMLELNAARAGRIGALGIYGTTKISDVTVKDKERSIDDQPPIGETVDFNYANLAAGGEVAYTSSARANGEADKMIDDVPDTRYEFAPVDPAPVAVIQLEASRPVRRISISYDAEKPGKMEFYLLNEIPGKPIEGQGSRQRESESRWIRASYLAVPRILAAQAGNSHLIEVEPSFFQNNRAAGSVATETGRRRVAFECPPKQSLYLMVRWLANDGSTAGKFSISEINIFGNTKKEDVEVTWAEPKPPGEGSQEKPNTGLPSLPGSTSSGSGGGSIEPPDLPTISQP